MFASVLQYYIRYRHLEIARHNNTMSTMKILMIIVTVSLGCASADCIPSFNQLDKTTQACLGDNLTFECSTVPGVGSTVFQGDLLDCNDSSNEIILTHSRFSNMSAAISRTCNSGKVHGYSLPFNDSEPCYTSQLHVTVSPDMIGKSIICVDDDGATAEEIGNYTIEECHTTTVTITAPLTVSVWTATIVYENNTKSSTTMDMYNSAVRSLSSGEVAAIVLCCLAVLVGIMIAAILLLTYCGFKLKRKQLPVIQTSNSGHSAIQEESISMSIANMEQQTQATFHCALNDEVSGYTLCTTDYDCIAVITDDSEYSRLQHPGGQHAQQSRANLQLTHMQF